MEFISKSLEETAEIASNFASGLKLKESGATVFGLYGELGSGKTTFMKFLAECLGIKETIQSPTFVIMRRHDLTPSPSPCEGEGRSFNNLIHIDAYRIENEIEMLNLGWKEIISDSKNLIFIEWPERIAGIMPEHSKIIFEHINENERKIKITE